MAAKGQFLLLLTAAFVVCAAQGKPVAEHPMLLIRGIPSSRCNVTKTNVTILLRDTLRAALRVEKRRIRISSDCDHQASPNKLFSFCTELAICGERIRKNGRIRMHFLAMSSTGALTRMVVEDVPDHKIYAHLRSLTTPNRTALFTTDIRLTARASCSFTRSSTGNGQRRASCDEVHLKSSGLHTDRYVAVEARRPTYKLRNAQRRVVNGDVQACAHSPGPIFSATDKTAKATSILLYSTLGSEHNPVKPKRCPIVDFTDAMCDDFCGSKRGKRCTGSKCPCRHSRRLLSYYTLL
eukprot:scpid88041/ scgid13155/ 